jgi:hypothetical protein
MKRDTSWAIEIEPQNYQAIISEGGREINREFLDRWLEKYPEGGYFIRDEARKQLNCTLMSADHFWTLYRRVERTVCLDNLPEGEECQGAHFFPIESDVAVDADWILGKKAS